MIIRHLDNTMYQKRKVVDGGTIMNSNDLVTGSKKYVCMYVCMYVCNVSIHGRGEECVCV